MTGEPIYFATPAELRDWFDEHHASASELWLGYHKKHTGRPSVTWSQAVDEAICVGWIDGVLKRIDDERHEQRFTPRRPRSIWSAINIKKVAALTEEGRMRPAGIAAFELRSQERSAIYAYEQTGGAQLEPEQQRRLEANAPAWAYFQSRPPSYRRLAVYWVISAKRPETRERRLSALIEDSANERLIKSQRPPGT